MTDLENSSGSAWTAEEPPTPLARFDIAVLRVDSDARVRFSNGVLERELGREPRALLGQTLDDLLDDRSRKRVADLLTSADAATPELFSA